MRDETRGGDAEGLERNFASNVRRRREMLGWSQSELARRMVEQGWGSYNQMTVSRTEKGERSVRLGEAQQLADVLGLRLAAMMQPTEASAMLGTLEDGLQRIGTARQAMHGAVVAFDAEREALAEALVKFDAEFPEARRAELGVTDDAERILGFLRPFAERSTADAVDDVLDALERQEG